MWKFLFEFCDFIFAIIPVKKWREYLRERVLFDYRKKLNALLRKYPNLSKTHMRLAKGGGSLVFMFNNKYTFKVRKYKHETTNFDRFYREKRITDALRDFCTIPIPNIEFVELDGFTFYKSDFIPGKLLVSIPTHRIKKYQNQISKQLAEFIYKKSFANPPELKDLRDEIKPDFAWNHTDMCSNILIDPKTMVVTGIIDWEWTRYTPLDHEFRGLVRVRKKMQKIGLDQTTKEYYLKLVK